MPLGTLDRTAPPLFNQGQSALSKLIFFGALSLFLMVADARFHIVQPVRSAIGASRLHRLAPWMPLWQGSIPASDPCSWILSVIRASAGMSASSQRRPSMYGLTSDVGWISTSSVHTTAHPPSALTPRMWAWAVGW